MWPSTHRRIWGPSLSRKNRLSAVIARKNASEESFEIPASTPSRSAWVASLTPALASCLAWSAFEGSRPRSLSQPVIVSCAEERWPPIELDSPVIPSTMTRNIAHPAATIRSMIKIVPSARGTRWP